MLEFPTLLTGFLFLSYYSLHVAYPFRARQPAREKRNVSIPYENHCRFIEIVYSIVIHDHPNSLIKFVTSDNTRFQKINYIQYYYI